MACQGCPLQGSTLPWCAPCRSGTLRRISPRGTQYDPTTGYPGQGEYRPPTREIRTAGARVMHVDLRSNLDPLIS